MLAALLKLFRQSPSAAPPMTIERAGAALLAEVMRIDRDIAPQERALAERAIRDEFGLPADEAARLLAAAGEEVRRAGDYYQYTSRINREFTQAQKEALLERLWRIAYADGRLSADELHLLRKIAGLLHLPDSAYIAAKLRAKAARG